jgi:hypothetical protein
MGGRGALLAQLAGAESTVRCRGCDELAPIATSRLSLLVETPTANAQGPGFVRLSFAHRRCRSSAALTHQAKTQVHTAQALAEYELRVARGLRSATPTPVVLFEPAGRAYYEATAGGEPRDLFVSALLKQGWALLDGDPQSASLPVVGEWGLIAHEHRLTLYDRDGNRPIHDATVPPLPGWQQAYEAERYCTLIAGTVSGSTPASLACWRPSAAGASLVRP